MWCVECLHADWLHGETVYGQFKKVKAGLIKLDAVKLPACMRAQFFAALHLEIPDQSLEVTHIGRGPHSGQVIGISYLGACLEDEVCDGRNS